MTLVLNLEPLDFSEKAVAALDGVAIYKSLPETGSQDDLEFWQLVGDAEVIWTRLGRKLDANFFARAPRLRAIVSATTGLNHIDLAAAQERGIAIISLKGEVDFLSSITATAELTLSLILEAMRHTGRAHRAVVEDHMWDRDLFRGQQLSGKTLGIIGMGRLGRIVSEYAAAMRMKVLYCDVRPDASPPPGIQATRMEDLKALVSQSDIVSLHVDFTPQNRHMIDASTLRCMQPHAWLINTARGELVDEGALLKSLDTAAIGGAALDVLEDENLVALHIAVHPLIAYASANKNLILTPHIGGACDDAMAAAELHAARKLVSFLRQ